MLLLSAKVPYCYLIKLCVKVHPPCNTRCRGTLGNKNHATLLCNTLSFPLDDKLDNAGR